MSKAIEILQQTMDKAVATRPKIGGFPHLAESLRQGGVTHNIWSLPGCQSLYLTEHGPVMMQGKPLISEASDVPCFDSEALIRALRTDQAGQSTFPEFLEAAWRAGVVSYVVDFAARTVEYQGPLGERYVEAYPKVEVVA